ncbi:CrtK protein [Sphingomonas sp. Leaf23]|uniref:TspO/MBR family protein n=1 Tax=Sphingomonas sp. Leaf23 TaxID=1735689 RepID=UPI0006FF58E0|nr:TspO/MBR family protein [Sphingomonas sp. Leaf23]KQM86351.1 CrtK protein [Sphingomonas sp. Leaf23]
MNEIASKWQLRSGFLRRAVVCVPLILLLGFTSGQLVVAGDANGWYRLLDLPAIRPPNRAFPVVWTILYLMLGFAIAVVLNARGARGRGIAIALFVAQLAMNLVWSPLFFGAHQVTLALYLIVALFFTALATTFAFGRIRPLAAWLLVPYLVWLVIASALNWQIDRRNPNAETLVPPAHSTQITL